MRTRLDVVVGVLTFKRPAALDLTLERILAQVTELDQVGGVDVGVRVVVVDNDPQASARGVAEKYPSITYVVEPVPGISAGRNRALDEAADGDVLVFIDDDETPLEKWLSSLVETWQSTGATAVMGRVVSVFETTLDPWIAAGGFFVRRTMPSGTPITVAAAGNLLLDLHQMSRIGARFDPAMGLTGGEDTLLSRHIIEGGGTIVWCDESAALDHVPASRTTKKWVLTRAWSHGNTATLVDLKMSATPGSRSRVRAKALVKGSTRIAGGTARCAWGVLRGNLRDRARGRRAVYRGAGLMSGALGIAYLEYARGSRWRWRRDVESGSGS